MDLKLQNLSKLLIPPVEEQAGTGKAHHRQVPCWREAPTTDSISHCGRSGIRLPSRKGFTVFQVRRAGEMLKTLRVETNTNALKIHFITIFTCLYFISLDNLALGALSRLL